MSPAVTVEQLKAAKAAVQEIVKANNCHPIMVRLAWHDSGSYCGEVGDDFTAFTPHTRLSRTAPKTMQQLAVHRMTRTLLLVASLQCSQFEIGGCHPATSLVISTGNTSWPTSNVYRVITRLICASAFASQPGWPCAGGATGSIRFAPEINHGANAGLSAAVALLQPVHEKFPEVSWADLIQMASAVAIEVRAYHMPRRPQLAHAHGSSAAVNLCCSGMQISSCIAIKPTLSPSTIT